MVKYVLGRLAQFAFVLVGLMLLVFVALHMVTDPFARLVELGVSGETIAEVRRAQGLDGPMHQQALNFLGGAFQGDFGRSLWLGGDPLDAALDRYPTTLLLVLPTVFIAALAGTAIAIYTARRRRTLASQVLNVVSFGAFALPEFWLALMLILVVSVRLDLLPSGGAHPRPAVLVLPAIVLGVRPFVHAFQVLQATMAAEYGKQYVMAARARGLTESQVARRHVLRNAAVPVVTLLFYDLGIILFGGAIVVETVFGWPGIGSLLVGALAQGDVFLVEAIVAIAAVSVGLLNLIADLLSAALDPRARAIVRGGRA